MDAGYWIEKLNLIEHPEGGFFRETYRSGDHIPHAGLPERFTGPRSFSTAIYFLVSDCCPSRLHRLKSDELWHFYTGAPLTLHLFHPDGRYEPKLLGSNVEAGESFQIIVPAGCWFGATVDVPDGYTLAGCTVAPGFDFTDFLLARRSELLLTFPDHASLIEQLTSPDDPPDLSQGISDLITRPYTGYIRNIMDNASNTTAAHSFSSATAFLIDAVHEFRRLKDLAERALAQTDDAGFFFLSGPESNSIAIVVKHLAGNMISRWTDFLTTDGEKPDRRRDGEFVLDEGEERAEIMERWEDGWRILFATLEGLTPDDLGRTITIRGEGHSAQQAIFRQVSHYAYHVGQIVFLAKELRGSEWTSLSIPRGKSGEFAHSPKPYRS